MDCLYIRLSSPFVWRFWFWPDGRQPRKLSANGVGDHQRPIEQPYCPRLGRPPVCQIERCRKAKAILRLPDLEQSKNAVLHSLAAPSSQALRSNTTDPFEAFRARIVRRRAPCNFSAMQSSHCASVISNKSICGTAPATLTSASILPKRSSVPLMTISADCGSRRSGAT
jgi:hypothetical protein